jgi:hypothetical protein
MNDEAPYCDSCGARTWRVVPNQQIGPKVWGVLSLLLVLGFIALLIWQLPAVLAVLHRRFEK